MRAAVPRMSRRRVATVVRRHLIVLWRSRPIFIVRRDDGWVLIPHKLVGGFELPRSRAAALGANARKAWRFRATAKRELARRRDRHRKGKAARHRTARAVSGRRGR